MSNRIRYTQNYRARISGNSRQAIVMIAPAAMVAAFGAPPPGAKGQTTGEYRFTTTDGLRAFAVYDYKNTPDWTSADPFPFHVGARDSADADDFCLWLKKAAAGQGGRNDNE